MAQLIADRRDVDFVLHEQIGMVTSSLFDEFNKKTIDLIVSEARNLAKKEITNGDSASFEDVFGETL
jgi:hypothetical protein